MPSNALPEAGAICVVDRGYVDFARLYVLHQAAFFVTRAVEHRCSSRLSAPTDRSTGIICDQTISLDGFYTRQDYPELLRRIRFKDFPSPARRWSSSPTTSRFRPPTICALYKSRWQPSSSGSSSIFGSSLRHVGERGEDADPVSVYVLVAIVKKRLDLDASLYTLLQILSVTLFDPYIKHLRETKTDATLRK